MSAERTLGSELRAARLGFRWLPRAGRYVRVSDMLSPQAGWDAWRVEWCTPDRLPKMPGKDQRHRAWWEVDGAAAVLANAIAAQWPDVLPEAGAFTHAEPEPARPMDGE